MELRIRRDYRNTLNEFFRRMFAPEELSREMENRLAHEVVMLGRHPEPEVAGAGLQILATADLRESLSVIDLPALIIHGAEDSICPPAAGRYLAENIPGARLELLEGMGHAPFLSHPELFNQLLLDFESSLNTETQRH